MQATVFRCDKCKQPIERERGRRLALDLCAEHRAEFLLWMRTPSAWVSVAEKPAADASAHEPAEPVLELDRIASAQGAVFRIGSNFSGRKPPEASRRSEPVVSAFPSQPGRLPHAQPACTMIKRSTFLASGLPPAPVRAGAIATGVGAPARPVAPGFPLPGAAPDHTNRPTQEAAPGAPVVPLLDAPPPAPASEDEPAGLELLGTPLFAPHCDCAYGPESSVHEASCAELREGDEDDDGEEDSEPPPAPPPSSDPPAPPSEQPQAPPPAAAAARDLLDDCTCSVRAKLEMDPTFEGAHFRTCAAGHRIVAEQMERAAAAHRALLATLPAASSPPASTPPGQGLHRVPPPVQTVVQAPRLMCRCASRDVLLKNPAAVVPHARACPLARVAVLQAAAAASMPVAPSSLEPSPAAAGGLPDAHFEGLGFIVPPATSPAVEPLEQSAE